MNDYIEAMSNYLKKLKNLETNFNMVNIIINMTHGCQENLLLLFQLIVL
jgi:hypothetical protein